MIEANYCTGSIVIPSLTIMVLRLLQHLIRPCRCPRSIVNSMLTVSSMSWFCASLKFLLVGGTPEGQTHLVGAKNMSLPSPVWIWHVDMQSLALSITDFHTQKSLQFFFKTFLSKDVWERWPRSLVELGRDEQSRRRGCNSHPGDWIRHSLGTKLAWKLVSSFCDAWRAKLYRKMISTSSLYIGKSLRRKTVHADARIYIPYRHRPTNGHPDDLSKNSLCPCWCSSAHDRIKRFENLAFCCLQR